MGGGRRRRVLRRLLQQRTRINAEQQRHNNDHDGADSTTSKANAAKRHAALVFNVFAAALVFPSHVVVLSVGKRATRDGGPPESLRARLDPFRSSEVVAHGVLLSAQHLTKTLESHTRNCLLDPRSSSAGSMRQCMLQKLETILAPEQLPLVHIGRGTEDLSFDRFLRIAIIGR